MLHLCKNYSFFIWYLNFLFQPKKFIKMIQFYYGTQSMPIQSILIFFKPSMIYVIEKYNVVSCEQDNNYAKRIFYYDIYNAFSIETMI